MKDAAIYTEQLTCDFSTCRALDSLSLTIPRGSVFGLLGSNGAGKTTTLRLLLGLIRPTGGQARVLNLDPQRQAAQIRAHVGVLLEHPGIYDRLSAQQNLAFYARLWGLASTERDVRIRELLQTLGLWEKRRERVGLWSRGMRQKLAIARALLHHPQVIFLDEPTAGLDIQAAASLCTALAELVEREDVTVLLTTHNMREAERLCTQVGVLAHGKLIASGSPHDLQKSGGVSQMIITGDGFTPSLVARIRGWPEIVKADGTERELVVTLQPDQAVGHLVQRLTEAGVIVDEVREQGMSLEATVLALLEGNK